MFYLFGSLFGLGFGGEMSAYLVVDHSDDDARSFLWYAATKTGGTHGQKISREPD
jgi:hypothetical protein